MEERKTALLVEIELDMQNRRGTVESMIAHAEKEHEAECLKKRCERLHHELDEFYIWPPEERMRRKLERGG